MLRKRKSLINTEKIPVRVGRYQNKISTIFRSSEKREKCGYVENLYSEEVFPDFMDISGTHSYQQISRCAIFQQEIFNLIKSGKIMTVTSKGLYFFLKVPGGNAQRICFPGGIDICKDNMPGCGERFRKVR